MQKLIAIYGISKPAKRQLVSKLATWLHEEKYQVDCRKYPNYSCRVTGLTLSEHIHPSSGETPLLSPLVFQMLCAINRIQDQPRIQKSLENGACVLVQDYVGSGVAWGLAEGLNINQLLDLNNSLVYPGLSILVEGGIDVEARVNHIHENNKELTEKTREIFRSLSKKYGWRVVHANSTEPSAFESARKLIEEKMLT